MRSSLKPGEIVADVGAGSGYFTVRLAASVGGQGRVLAVDISPDMVLHMNRRLRDAGIRNVQTVLSAPDDPLLADASVDLFFICDTWHHIEERPKYLGLLKRMLRGGRPDRDRGLPQAAPPLRSAPGDEDLARGRREGARGCGLPPRREHTFLPYQYFLVFEAK